MGDIVIGAPGASDGVGRAYVVYGNSSGIDEDFDMSALEDRDSAGLVMTGREGGTFSHSIGYAVAAAGYARDTRAYRRTNAKRSYEATHKRIVGRNLTIQRDTPVFLLVTPHTGRHSSRHLFGCRAIMTKRMTKRGNVDMPANSMETSA